MKSAAGIALVVSLLGTGAGGGEAAFRERLDALRRCFPRHFLPDVAIVVTSDLERPTVFGEPDPPEGFAGPDPTGRRPLGIYLPSVDKDWFPGDISNEQWVFHEMFHLHNRRIHDYEPFIQKAFPDDSDPLVQWIRRDRFHRTFAREEAFINLITFADPARTPAQREAVRQWFDYIGAAGRSLPELRALLNVVDHPVSASPAP
jgi:hypothetical protein